jgi:hypothetical protein
MFWRIELDTERKFAAGRYCRGLSKKPHKVYRKDF